jgi:hypothetical protein
MGFPFFAPLEPWVVGMMEEREANPHMAMFRNPFAVLTSGARVTKAGANVASGDEETRMKQIKEALESDKGYKGCIISNNINNLDLSYSTNETIVGVDFDGNYIKVDGETGRKVSTPIIESIDIDTDGANNTLKTAKVTVKCFTLKQFEMFELFFMKPGMNVLVEWGDSSLLKADTVQRLNYNSPQVDKKKLNTYSTGEPITIGSVKSPEECLVHKTESYDDFCDKFSDYYRSDTAAIAKYLTKKEESRGSYDLVAGKVLEYSFSIEQDGTYTCNIEVSQGNQISLAIPHKPRSEKSTDKRTPKQPDTEFDTTEQVIQRICADFNFDRSNFDVLIKKHPEEGGAWIDDWFNFVKINKEQKDTVASDTAYVSFRFILEILVNYVVDCDGGVDESFFRLGSQEWKKEDGSSIKAIPVTSNKWIMSSSDNVIFPRKGLPVLKAPKTKDKKPPEGEEGEIQIVEDSNNDCRIGNKIKYDFHLSDKIILPKKPAGEVEKLTEYTTFIGPQPQNNPDEKIGNALNIFIKYESVVKAWKSTYTRIDFLTNILSIINNNSYGLFLLIYGIQRENSVPTIIDYKLAPEDIKIQNTDVTYRFKPTTIKSIVKQFSFNFEMSNLVAGRTIFNSGKFLTKLKKENKDNQNFKVKDIGLPPNAYKSVDHSTLGNADGWYPINNVELKKIEKNWNQAKADAEDPKKNQVTKEENPEATKEAENLDDVIKNKSIKYLIDEKVGSKLKTLVYRDAELIQNMITKSGKEAKIKKPTLSPIELTVVIDGFSGFTPGQYFCVDGIPEIYNQTGVFQITNTKHNISKDGWTTTIEASHRPVNKK